ncbi:MAG: response regulator [Nitrospiria bacterium]
MVSRYLEDIKRLYPQIKVLMITGFPSSDTQMLCAQKGAEGYLVKPIEINELKKTIQLILN